MVSGERSAGSGAARIARFAMALIGVSMRSALAERGAFFMRAALMAINNGIFFTFWIVLLSRVPRIRGYELGDVALLYGIVAVANGLLAFFVGGFHHLARVIHDGELDALIAQPKPTLLYALGLKSQPAGLGDIVSGIIMIALSHRVGIAGIPLAVAAIVGGALALLATAVLLHSAAFWLGRTETASRQLYEATLLFSLYPDTLFGGVVRFMLFTLVPAGFVGFLPSQVIRSPSPSAAGALALGVVLYAGAAWWVFRRGLLAYSSGSRFSTFG